MFYICNKYLSQLFKSLLVLLLLISSLNAQMQINCSKENSLDWENNKDRYPMGENWDWTDNTNCYVLYHARQTNSQDWRATKLPYFSDYGPTAQNWVLGADIYSKDGWQFMHGDFGTPHYEGNITPYLLFYNRHISVLRLFFFYTGATEHTKALVVLGFNESNYKLFTSGLLTTEMDTCRYLDDNMSSRVVSQTVEIEDLKWSHVDINVRGWDDRDLKEYYSQLKFSIYGVDVSEVILNGDLNLDQTEIGSSGASSLSLEKAISEGKSAHAWFKTGNDFIDFLDERGKGKKNTHLQAFNEKGPLRKFTSRDNAKKSELAHLVDDPLIKALPYVGAFASVLSGFSGGGTSTQPIHLTGKIGLSGTIKTSKSITQDILIDLPSSKIRNNSINKPTFNNKLGLFKLKKRPKIKLTRVKIDRKQKTADYSNYYLTVYHDKDIVRITDPIEIVINPESEMYLKTGKVAFVPYDTTGKSIFDIKEGQIIQEWEWMPLTTASSYSSEIKGYHSYRGREVINDKLNNIYRQKIVNEQITPVIELKKPVMVLNLVFSLKQGNPNISDIVWQGLYIPEYDEVKCLQAPISVTPRSLNDLQEVLLKHSKKEVPDLPSEVELVEVYVESSCKHLFFNLVEGEYQFDKEITIGENFESPVTLRAISGPEAPFYRKPAVYLGNFKK